MKNVTILFPAAAFWMFGVMGCEPSHNVVGELPLDSTAPASAGTSSTSTVRTNGGAASTSAAPESGGASSISTLKFLWIPKEDPENNLVFKLGKKGAEAKAQELSNNGNINVQVSFSATKSADDVKGQAEIVRSAMNGGYSGVAVSCNSADGLKEAIDDVVKAGIPVMTFDSDSPKSGRFTYLAGDNWKAGALAAKILGTAMGANPPRKKVALISGGSEAQNLIDRVDGFLATIKEQFPGLDPLPIAYCEDKEALAAKLVEDIMDNNPDLGGFFFVGHWPLHACGGSECSQTMQRWNQAALYGVVKTVAFDALEYELDFVKTGQVAGLVGQRYWGWGADSIQMLYDRVRGSKGFESWTESGLDVVCGNNVNEMQNMWTFESVPPQLTVCKINDVDIVGGELE